MNIRLGKPARTLGAALVVLLGLALLPAQSVAAAAPVLLSGKVTAADTAKPLQYVRVLLTNSDVAASGPGNVGFATTHADGTYQIDISGLNAGDYTLYFGEAFRSPYQTEYWNNKPRTGTPDLITLNPSTAMPGMNVSLARGPELPTYRVAGADRFATAVEISQSGWDPFDTDGIIFVANGLNYPDALSGAALAGGYASPLLLVRPDSIPDVVRGEITRLHPGQIVVLGGTGVVSNAVFSELELLAPEVLRVSGANRYATSREAATYATNADTIFLATGRGYADALSAASAAGTIGAAVLLVDGALPALDADTVALLSSGYTTVNLVGGTGVISAGIENQLRNVLSLPGERLAGANRYLTSLAINEAGFNNGSFTDVSQAFVATGTGYADALAGAALAGSFGEPLYLSQPTCLPEGLGESLLHHDVPAVVLFGGTGVLSSGVMNLQTCLLPSEVRPK